MPHNFFREKKFFSFSEFNFLQLPNFFPDVIGGSGGFEVMLVIDQPKVVDYFAVLEKSVLHLAHLVVVAVIIAVAVVVVVFLS